MSTRIECDWESLDSEPPETCNNSVHIHGDTEGWVLYDSEDAVGDYCPDHSWWSVWIERMDGSTISFGPYPTEKSAIEAMENSLLIESECMTDATDCWVAGNATSEDIHVIIDISDPHHTGVGA